jgi:hypothetical protein
MKGSLQSARGVNGESMKHKKILVLKFVGGHTKKLSRKEEKCTETDFKDRDPSCF